MAKKMRPWHRAAFVKWALGQKDLLLTAQLDDEVDFEKMGRAFVILGYLPSEQWRVPHLVPNGQCSFDTFKEWRAGVIAEGEEIERWLRARGFGPEAVELEINGLLFSGFSAWRDDGGEVPEGADPIY